MIYKSIDENKYIEVVFLDMKKAFDTAEHHIMLQELSRFGLDENVVNWFKSYFKFKFKYLSNRRQWTKIGGSKSSLKPIMCGVPQGSILRPLLCILYINDLYEYFGTPASTFLLMTELYMWYLTLT